MNKQAELNNRMSKGSSQREIRPVWNKMQRMNHQKQFVPKAVLTRTGKIPVNIARTSGTNTVNAARHNFNSQAVPVNAARKVNTVKPIVNNARPKSGFHKYVSPFRKSFTRTTALRTNFSKQKVNTAEVNAVSAVKERRETAVKSSTGCNWRPKRHYWNQDYPQRALQNKGIVDSGCSKHMTGNKAYLAEYQDFNGGPLPDENQVLLRIHRQNNMYSFNLENIVPSVTKKKQGFSHKEIPEKEAESAQDYLYCKMGLLIQQQSGELKSKECRITNDAAEALQKEFAKDTEDLLLQAGAAKASSTNTVNTASTPVSTASPYVGLSFTDTNQDDLKYLSENLVRFKQEKSDPNFGSHALRYLKHLENESWVDLAGRTLQFKIQKDMARVSGIDYVRFFAPVARIEALGSFSPLLLTCLCLIQGNPQQRFQIAWQETLLHWQCKKQMIVATSTIRQNIVAAANSDIRSDLLFDDADEIDYLPNQAIFDVIQLMGECNTFDSMLVQPTEDEGVTLERQSKPQPIPSPPHLKGSWWNQEVQSSSKSLSGNEGGMTLQSVYDLCISLCTQMSLDDDISRLDETEDLKMWEDKLLIHEEKECQENGVRRSATQTAPTTTTPTIFGNDETIAQVLIIMSQNKEKLKEKEKGVELKDVEETERPRPINRDHYYIKASSQRFISQRYKKKIIRRKMKSNTDSYDITEAEKKFKGSCKGTKGGPKGETFNADKILAEKLQEEEREMYTIEQRAKFLHDTIAAQRRFLAQQRSEAIRNKPPSRNQLRNQMMTYLKHVGGKKHYDLKTKVFVDASKKRVKKDDSIKGEIKEEEGTRKRKLGIRKKMKSKKRKFTSKDDEEELRLVFLPIVLNSIRSGLMIYLTKMLFILDKDDIYAIDQLVMNRYQDETHEGFDKILWGDLIIDVKSQVEMNEFCNAQQNWKLKNKYPLKKEVLSQLLKLKLETEEDSIMALELLDLSRSRLIANPSKRLLKQTATGKEYKSVMAGICQNIRAKLELDVVVLLKRQVADEDG
ncbi:hypothetical protein Tco_0880994 [Tanacetum coccineum]